MGPSRIIGASFCVGSWLLGSSIVHAAYLPDDAGYSALSFTLQALRLTAAAAMATAQHRHRHQRTDTLVRIGDMIRCSSSIPE